MFDKHNKHKRPAISVILTTYNWPEALHCVLQALMDQTCQEFEIIVADDGSGAPTAQLIQSCQKKTSIPILHVWQEDQGFRASAIRNKAIKAATGSYLVFLDGDCIPRTGFVEAHQQLAESGFFVVGHRILLNAGFTLKVLDENLNVHRWPLRQWFWQRLKGHCNRFFSLIPIPLGKIRKFCTNKIKDAKGCNLGIWKSDLVHINGWEEEFEGWGYEDSDLVLRLINHGVKRKDGRFLIPVIHLWHPEQDRSRASHNWALFQSRRSQGQFICAKGLNQY